MLTVVAAVMFLDGPAPFACRRSLTLGPLLECMPLRHSLRGRVPANARIGMNVCAPVVPGTSPRGAVNYNHMPAPVKSSKPPAPGPEECTDRDTEAEADAAPTKNPGRGAKKTIPGS